MLTFEPLVFTVGLVAMVLLHEFGHAAAALLLGHRVFEIHLGVGWTRTFMLGSVAVQLGALPIGGAVSSGSPRRHGFRARRLVIVCAGVVANGLALGLLLIPGLFGPSAAFSFGLAVIVVILANGIPRKLGRSGTDGYNALRLVRATDADLDDWSAEYYGRRCLQLIAAGNLSSGRAALAEGLQVRPNSVYLLSLFGDDLLRENQPDEAATLFRRLLSESEVDPATSAEVRGALLANLALALALSARPNDVAEAVAISERALALQPNQPAVQLIRALALIESGEVTEGVNIAEAARPHVNGAERANAAAVIALGMALVGNVGQAGDWLRRGRRIDPHCYLLDRAASAIEVAASAPAPVAPGHDYPT